MVDKIYAQDLLAVGQALSKDAGDNLVGGDFVPAGVADFTAYLNAIRVAAGSPLAALTAELQAIVFGGGTNVSFATAAQHRARTPGAFLSVPEFMSDAWDRVSIPVVAGNAEIAGATFDRGFIDMTGDVTLTAPAGDSTMGLDGIPKEFVVFANGGDRFLNFSIFSHAFNGFGRTGCLVRSGARLLCRVWRESGLNIIEIAGPNGNPFAPVALTPAAGTPKTLAINGNVSPFFFSVAALDANLQFTAPSNIAGPPIVGLITASGGTRSITQTGFGIARGFGSSPSLAAGKSGFVTIQDFGGTSTISFAAAD